MSPQPPATYTRFRWVVLVALFVVTGTTALALISPAPLIPAIITQEGQTLSPGEITWMTMGWFNLFVAISALAGGFLIDRLGFIKIYAAGMVLILVGWLLVGSLGDSYGGMMFIRFIQGIGTGPIMASSAAVAATRFPLHERGIVTGTQGGAMAAGIGLGLTFMPRILDASGGDWVAALGSLWPVPVVALVLVAVIAFGPRPVAVRTQDLSAAEQEATRHALRRALATPAAWAAIASVTLMSWVHQAYNDLSPTYLMADPPLGLGMVNGSAMLGVAQIAFFFGAFAAGFATERIFRGRVRPSMVIGFGMGAIFGLGMLLPAATENPTIMLVVLCVAAFFFSWVNPSALAYIAKTYPESITGKLGGYAMGIGVFGGTAGVAAGSAALHATDAYTVPIIIMATVCALGIGAAYFLKQPKATATTPEDRVDATVA